MDRLEEIRKRREAIDGFDPECFLIELLRYHSYTREVIDFIANAPSDMEFLLETTIKNKEERE